MEAEIFACFVHRYILVLGTLGINKWLWNEINICHQLEAQNSQVALWLLRISYLCSHKNITDFVPVCVFADDDLNSNPFGLVRERVDSESGFPGLSQSLVGQP